MPGPSAKVNSIDALLRFKAFLAEFGEVAGLAVANAESDIQRTVWWIEHEARRHWEQQIRVREKKFAEAKSDLVRAELQSRDERPSCVVERKNMEKAKRRLEEARHKLERSRYWSRILERELMLYKGQMQSLAGRLDRDIPHGLARLDILMKRLEQYVKTAPPREEPPAATSSEPEGRQNDSR